MSETIADLIDALDDGHMAQAHDILQAELQSRTADALEAHKASVAASIFGDENDIEADDYEEEELEDVEYDEEDLELPEED